jgi:hypothetical protein
MVFKHTHTHSLTCTHTHAQTHLYTHIHVYYRKEVESGDSARRGLGSSFPPGLCGWPLQKVEESPCL